MAKRVVYKGSFKARAADGREFDILMFREMIGVSDIQEMPGALVLKTSSGRLVNVIKKGSYEIVDAPIISVTSDAPNAV